MSDRKTCFLVVKEQYTWCSIGRSLKDIMGKTLWESPFPVGLSMVGYATECQKKTTWFFPQASSDIWVVNTNTHSLVSTWNMSMLRSFRCGLRSEGTHHPDPTTPAAPAKQSGFFCEGWVEKVYSKHTDNIIPISCGGKHFLAGP